MLERRGDWIQVLTSEYSIWKKFLQPIANKISIKTKNWKKIISFCFISCNEIETLVQLNVVITLNIEIKFCTYI